MKTLTKENQIKIDIAMAYFHPEETIFSIDLQETKMLEALHVFENAIGKNEPEAIELRQTYNNSNKDKMYRILDEYIAL